MIRKDRNFDSPAALGRTVQLTWQGQVVEGKAEAIDQQGNLILKLADGSTFIATAGEVTSQV